MLIAHGQSPLCHMVFSSEGKRDQHIKYSPVHAPPAEGSEPQPAPEPTMDSITIYSGTKLFWRTRLNVELFMQQHKIANAVQVRSTQTMGSGWEWGGVAIAKSCTRDRSRHGWNVIMTGSLIQALGIVVFMSIFCYIASGAHTTSSCPVSPNRVLMEFPAFLTMCNRPAPLAVRPTTFRS